MRVSGSADDVADIRRLHVCDDRKATCYGKVERQRQSAALALARRFTAIVLTRGVAGRGFDMRGIGRGCAVQRTGVAIDSPIRRVHKLAGLHALGHCVSNIHFQSKGELQRQDGKEESDEGYPTHVRRVSNPMPVVEALVRAGAA